MTRRYLITLVGSEEQNGSRTITTKDEGDGAGPILFAVDREYLKDYVPNAGDTIIRYDDGRVWFELQ